ncbi:hypothetical protein TNCV_2987641 [Trichonephila clavipes]|nr:hypothetical protein TNCV_2987641 [Trichonephila clavipes]
MTTTIYKQIIHIYVLALSFRLEFVFIENNYEIPVHHKVLHRAHRILGFGWKRVAINSGPKESKRHVKEKAQNEIAVVPDFHKRILFSDEVHFWLNGYVNKQNCRIWSEANPQVYVETPLHPEKLTVWCALWAGGILLQKR